MLSNEDPTEPDPFEELRAIARRVTNWGRWGDDDELGTLNLLTPEAVRRGASSVAVGKTFTLGLELGSDGPQTGAYGRVNPLHYMSMIGQRFSPASHDRGVRISDDVIVMNLQAATQWDGLAHVYYDGLLFNGHSADESLGAFGARRDGIDKQSTKAFTSRGLLLDVPRALGMDWLPDSMPITPEILDQTVEFGGVDPLPGDILLVRTGHIRVFLENADRDRYKWAPPGLTMHTAPWLHERGIAAVAADNNAVEVMPFEDPAVEMPLHMLCLRDMGMPLGEMFDLETLAADCAGDGIYAVQFNAQPLRVRDGIASPVNPTAIK